MLRRRRAWFDWRFVKGESRRAYRLAFLLFWSLLLYFFCQRYVVTMGIVTDRSMLPALAPGNYVLVNKYIYHVSRPKRGDIAVIRPRVQGSEEYVKRVIGLPGETVLIRSGHVYIDGRRLVEPYVLSPTLPDAGPYRLGKEQYFVLGDNRPESDDSRFFGPVELKDLEGKISPRELFRFQ